VYARALSHLGLPSASVSLTTPTLAATPQAGTIASVKSSSLTVQWSLSGVGMDNSTGTFFQIERSTDSQFSSVAGQSGWTADLSSTPVNLLTGNTYYFRLRARNWAGLETDYSDSFSTNTVLSPPSIYSYNVNVTSFVVSLSSNGNPVGTRFEISTVTAFTAAITSAGITSYGSPAASLLLSNLLPNTTYTLYSRAVGETGSATALVSLTTPTLPAIPESGSFSQVGFSSVAIQWSLSGQTGTSPTGTQFQIERSTDAQFNPVSGQSGWSTGLSSTPANLVSNASYYFRVRARNWGQVETSYSQSFSTVTLARPVSIYSYTVNLTSFVVTLSSNGNSLGTRFEISTTPAFSAGFSTAGPVGYGNDAVVLLSTGLLPNTTFTIYARAIGRQGEPSATVTLTTTTLAATPQPGSFSQVNVSSGTVAWSLSGVGVDNSSGTEFQVERSTVGSFSPLSGQSDWSASLSTAPVRLLANTSYYFRVKARNLNLLETAYSQTFSTVTLASVPQIGTFTAVNVSSVAAQWSLTGVVADNPADTIFQLERSTDSGFAGLEGQSGWSTDLASTSVNLIPNTSYYYRVRGRNRVGTETAYSQTFATTTLTYLPELLSYAVNTTSFTISLSSNGNTVRTRFEISTGTAFTAAITSGGITGYGSPAVSLVSSNLLPNTTYTVYARAVNHRGVPSNTISLTTPSLASVPQVGTFPQVGFSSVTVQWSLSGAAGDNPVDTLFQIERSTESQFNPVSGQSGWVTDFSSTSVNLLANVTYYFRLRARNWSRLETNYSQTFSTVTILSPPEIYGYSLNVTSFTISLSSNGNPVGTRMEVSTTTEFTTAITSAGITGYGSPAVSLLSSNLNPNTRYTFYARAVNGSGAPTSIVNFSTTTLASTPQVGTFSWVGFSSVTIQISSSGETGVNPAVTEYRVERSTDSQFNPVTGIRIYTTNLTYTPANLFGNTSYYFRIRARNQNRIETDYSQ
ncbi:MAG: hypothetical protein HYY07_05685, partial [Elusimicrobia bacterium]|nr:hypothetical protein [Elusimicrobiota bacterium]